MYLEEQKRLTVAIQFVFNPDTNTLKTTDEGDIEVYKITPNGRFFIGYKGLRDHLWFNFLDLLCENTLSTVTFYSETYTKAMMPDRIAGNLSDLMIAYSRVYKAFNPNDADVKLNHNGEVVWDRKRITYPVDFDHYRKIELENNKENDCYKFFLYPFIVMPRHLPEILILNQDAEFRFSSKIGAYAFGISYPYTYFNTESRYSNFPNVKLKPNLNNDTSLSNRDPFNILL